MSNHKRQIDDLISKIGKNYPTNAVQNDIIDKLSKNYSFLRNEIIGKSLCGREITCLEIGNPDLEAILMVGAFHGMEWQTRLVLLRLICEICRKIHYEQIDFFKKCIKIIPCINPDGVEIQISGAVSALKFGELVQKTSKGNTKIWQANARGVDLNHNFNAGWEEVHKLEQLNGINGPSTTRYGGEFPESEPESKSLADFCRMNKISAAFAFHSQGEEIYYDFGENTPKTCLMIAKRLAYISKYKVSKPEKIATGAGFKDWFIEEFKKPGFTIEIGKGKNPLPLSDFNKIYNKLSEMLNYIAFEF